MKKLKVIKIIFFLIIALPGLFSALDAFAQTPTEGTFLPLVRCESEKWSGACTFCEIFHLINRVIKLIIYYIIPPLAVVAFIYAGILLLFGGAAPKNIETGKKIFQVTIIGILIAFSGWLIVNTILQQLVNPEAKLIWWPWNKIPECAEEGTPIVSPASPTPIGPPSPFEPPVSPPTETQTLECGASGVSSLLTALTTCVENAVSKRKDITLGQITTTGGKHACDLNRKSISCHYGGTKCNGVGHAVDYGGPGGGGGGKIYEEIRKIASACGAGGAFCEDGNGNRLDCYDSNVNHVHVNDFEGTPSECGCN